MSSSVIEIKDVAAQHVSVDEASLTVDLVDGRTLIVLFQRPYAHTLLARRATWAACLSHQEAR
jgi:hypothetical protein